MAGERGSAVVAAGTALVIMLSMSMLAEAATYTVGDAAGWTANVGSWARGKKNFTKNDILVFKYAGNQHNVVDLGTSKRNYDSCTLPANAQPLVTGNDRITLSKPGVNYYFICSIPGHCKGGMRLSVTVQN